MATLTASAQQHTPSDRAALLALAEDFRRRWNDPAADLRMKKRLVRVLIEGISATTRTEPTPQIELLIHWAGGKHTRLILRSNRPGQHRWSTERALVDVVRELARVLPDGQVARVLNRLGYHMARGAACSSGDDNTERVRQHADRPEQHLPPRSDSRMVGRLEAAVRRLTLSLGG